MSEIDHALLYALRWEGGWSDDPDDPGGATNYGITLQRAKKHGISTKDALRDISAEKVREIYLKDYWCFGEVTSQSVASKVFSHCINMGDSPWIRNPAIKVLQLSLCDLGQSIRVDGVFGRATLAAVNLCDAEKLLERFAYRCALRYQQIAINNPKMQKFLHGWLRRANDFPEEARHEVV